MTTYERNELLDEMNLTDEELDAIAEEVELMDAMEHRIALLKEGGPLQIFSKKGLTNSVLSVILNEVGKPL